MDETVRAVVPIHYAGVACDLGGIETVLERWPRAELVEDNAHGLFGRHRGEPLGSFGRFASLSFHETKNFICGEGGALIVNDDADVDRAHVLYHKGTNRRAFLLGQVDKYSWQDIGSSFGLSDVLAAYLYGQLERASRILAKRRHGFDRYQRLSRRTPSAWAPPARRAARPRAGVPHVLRAAARRGDPQPGARAMHERGVHATFHYVPLHSSPGGRRFAARPTSAPSPTTSAGASCGCPSSPP